MYLGKPRALSTKLDLLIEARTKKALGHSFVQLVISRRQAPKSWDKVRILPSAAGMLYGRCVGEVDPRGGMRRFLIDVQIDDIERAIPVDSPGLGAEDKKEP